MRHEWYTDDAAVIPKWNNDRTQLMDVSGIAVGSSYKGTREHYWHRTTMLARGRKCSKKQYHVKRTL